MRTPEHLGVVRHGTVSFGCVPSGVGRWWCCAQRALTTSSDQRVTHMPREAKKSVAGSSQRGIPNTSITLADKFDILKKMEEGVSVRSIMAEYNMGKSTVYNLKNDRAKLHKFQRESSEGIAEKRTRLLFADKYKDIEQATLRWYKQRRGAGVPIRGIEIKNAAKRFADLFDITHFRASSGWLFRFERRHGLVYKRIMGRNMAEEPMGPLGQNPLDHQAYLIRNAINMRIRDRCRLVKTLDWARARGCLAPVPTWLEIQGLMEESLQAAVTGLGIKILGTLCAGAKSTATKVRLRFLAARKFTDTMYAELCLYMDSCLARLGSERTIAPGHGKDAKEMGAPGGGPSGGMRIMRDDEDSGAPKAKRRGFEDGGRGPPRKKVKKTKMEQATSVMGDLVMDTMEALEERYQAGEEKRAWEEREFELRLHREAHDAQLLVLKEMRSAQTDFLQQLLLFRFAEPQP